MEISAMYLHFTIGKTEFSNSQSFAVLVTEEQKRTYTPSPLSFIEARALGVFLLRSHTGKTFPSLEHILSYYRAQNCEKLPWASLSQASNEHYVRTHYSDVEGKLITLIHDKKTYQCLITKT